MPLLRSIIAVFITAGAYVAFMILMAALSACDPVAEAEEWVVRTSTRGDDGTLYLDERKVSPPATIDLHDTRVRITEH